VVTLDASQPFRHLDAGDLSALRQIAREGPFPAGSEIFREGDAGDGVYLVQQGRVEISIQVAPSTRRPLAQVGPGEMFGEMAVLELKPRSATAAAVENSVVYFIPREELIDLIGQRPKLALELLREISQRLREFNRRYLEEILQSERLAIIGRFARSIVHDLKNPLNVIGLTAEVASLPSATVESRVQAAGSIRKQVERIADMVGEILEFTQGSRKETLLVLVDYADYVRQVREEIAPEAQLRGVTLEVAPPPAALVRLDPKRLRRAFHNLVHNAADVLPAGGKVFWRVRIEGDEVVTEIEDTGPGIAPEIADKLFELFATFGKAHGTGLGLSICKKIIEDHHGSIWARNEPGKGAVFSFTLPLAH